MKRKLAVIVLFVYSMVTCKAMAQTVALDYYFNHETRTTKVGQVERSIGLTGAARPLLIVTAGMAAIAAITKYGKGTVIAVGYP